MDAKPVILVLVFIAAASARSVQQPGFGCESGVVQSKYLTRPSSVPKARVMADAKVVFKNKYSQVPSVTTGFTHIDNYHGNNLRLDSSVKSLTKTEMVVTIGKWDVSWLYLAKMSYMVCGPLAA